MRSEGKIEKGIEKVCDLFMPERAKSLEKSRRGQKAEEQVYITENN